MKLRLSSEFILGMGGTAFGFVFLRQADSLSYPSKVYPIFVAFLVLAVSALIMLRAIIRSKSIKVENVDSFTTNTFFVMATVVLYTISVSILGFYVSSFVCILVLSIITSQVRTTGRSLLNTVIASIVFLGSVYFIFSYLLNSSISRGLLF